MGYNERTIGGKPVSGTAMGFEDLFKSWLGVGQGGMTPEQKTLGIGQNLNLLAEGLLNPSAREGMRTIMQKNINRNAQDISTRYSGLGLAGGGTASGMAEAKFRGEAAPQMAVAENQMVMQTLAGIAPLLAQMMQWGSMGFPQAQSVLQPNFGMNVMQGLGGLATGAGSFMTGLDALRTP